MCEKTFLLHCVFALFALRRLVDDYKLGGVNVPLCVHPLAYLSFDTEAVFFKFFPERGL